jgi:hypothetical protein
LQQKPEYVYVTRGSNAEAHARRRFPGKILRYTESGIRPPDGVDAGPEAS